MKNVIIYTRVSTDEQADKGYSLLYQEERLRQYCSIQKINIVKHYKEDHSAKTFERPEFKKLKEFVLSNKQLIDGILFVKWDRFSRNTEESYRMIRYFSKMGIIVQAVEQPIDVSIPEQKILLAFYLAYPEIENDRRALNTRQGMIKAMKDGRWVSNAPIGYKNDRDLDNKPILILNEKAVLIREMFAKMATGSYSQEDIRREYYTKGIKIGKSHINRLFANPVYIGKIKIPKFQDEDERLIDGLFEPIIEEELFYKVQDILHSSRKRGKALKPKDENLPLRHHLKCPNCSRNLTGSRSKGNGGKYYYYHCQRGCKTRYSSKLAHSDFNLFLRSINMKPEVAKLYRMILNDVFEKSGKNRIVELSRIEKKIEEQSNRLTQVDGMLLDGKIDETAHKRMIKNINDNIIELSSEKLQFSGNDQDISIYIQFGFHILENINRFYFEAELEVKEKILSSIFPNRLIYENGKYRTNGMITLFAY